MLLRDTFIDKGYQDGELDMIIDEIGEREMNALLKEGGNTTPKSDSLNWVFDVFFLVSIGP